MMSILVLAACGKSIFLRLFNFGIIQLYKICFVYRLLAFKRIINVD